MGARVLGELPALPLHTAGKYVAAAYIVLFVLVLVYVTIMAVRLSRIERELGTLLALSDLGAEPEAATGVEVTKPEAAARAKVAEPDPTAEKVAEPVEMESTPA